MRLNKFALVQMVMEMQDMAKAEEEDKAKAAEQQKRMEEDKAEEEERVEDEIAAMQNLWVSVPCISLETHKDDKDPNDPECVMDQFNRYNCLMEEMETLRDWFGERFVLEEDFVQEVERTEDIKDVSTFNLPPADTKMQIFVKTSMSKTIALDVEPYMPLEVVK